jgi:hypothetical protein
VKHGERSHVSAGSCASIHWAFVLDFLSGAVLSAAFLSSLAAGAREGADMVSNPDERDDWCYIYPYLLFLITHSVDYIQLVLNSPIVAFKLVVEAILFSNYIR